MNGQTIGLLLPFAGTTLGAACVFLMKHKMNLRLEKLLMGFAAGVMVAAAVWSLLIPSMEMSGDGIGRIVPAVLGFLIGMGFLLLLDIAIPHIHPEGKVSEGPRSRISRTAKLVFAVTLHNIPEGMAVGVALAAAMDNNAFLPMPAAVALAAGIAIQNFPEGAIVSMPLRAAGNRRFKSFVIGTLSGAVEPIAALLTIWLASIVVPAMPCLLAFAAGAMIYVVVEELIPETQEGEHSNLGTIGFALGFALMMTLDVVLG